MWILKIHRVHAIFAYLKTNETSWSTMQIVGTMKKNFRSFETIFICEMEEKRNKEREREEGK